MWEDLWAAIQHGAKSAWGWVAGQIAAFDINEAISLIFSKAIGSFLLGAVVLIGGFFGGARLLERFREWLSARRVGSAAGEHYTVLVARLVGDTDNSQQRHVLQSLQRQLGSALVAIQPFPRTLEASDAKSAARALAAAEETGRAWLKQKSADLLVWGEVGKADKVLRLRFLSAGAAANAETKGYVLSKVLELPVEFGSDLSVVLEAEVTAGIRPAYESGRYVGDVLAPLLPRLRHLAQHPTPAFSNMTRGALLHAYAITAMRLGEQQGENTLLEGAMAESW